MATTANTTKYDTTQAAERIGLARRTLNIWRHKGIGPPYLKLGARVYYLETDIQRWMLRQRRVPRQRKPKAA